ncbi:MAG: protocatechuate 3,4-dioxygenase subunit alpha [Inquilinus limosus]|uniref:Protocatechuate 3,4-dioxygenase subunit alpha n=1 Tax=Inquilinus limosus TaxID=171674 RepID=A0A952KE99_9PROT|nr:protocatechuate 3,4-dioxygenase subunit alpha [Inquilinus limosus]
MPKLLQTGSQTVGPFFAYGLTPRQYGYNFPQIADGTMAGDAVPGERIRLTGRVLDGAGQPIEDALVEIWQADSQGVFPGPQRSANDGFTGFGRCGTGTDPDRRFVFDTIKPGVPSPGQTPHLSVIVFMRGMLVHVHTRIYFPDEPANAGDPVLNAVPDSRRSTLIAQADGPGRYRFDIRMQGDGETVFFEI